MSDDNTTTTTAGEGDTNEAAGFDWAAITGSSGKAAAPAAGAAPLPDLPEVWGRLPITCDTKRAIVQFPEAITGVKCAALSHNVSVLSDCGHPAEDVCLPHSLRARPLNDREIEVILSGKGEGTVKGLGWSAGPYPGGQLVTRSVEFGQPFVEVKVSVSRNIGCGCDAQNWASDDWQ